MKHALTLALLLTFAVQSDYLPASVVRYEHKTYTQRLLRDTWTHHIKREKYSWWNE